MKIGFYLGSFDPIHTDHQKLIAECYNQEIVDKVIILPAANHPAKVNKVSFDQRMNWVKTLYDGNPSIEVLGLESLNVSGRTYDLMKMIRSIWVYDDISIICGADLLEAFQTKWYKGQDFLKENKFIVFGRNSIQLMKLHPNVTYINAKTNNISSTFIRENTDKITELHVDPLIIDQVRAAYKS